MGLKEKIQSARHEWPVFLSFSGLLLWLLSGLALAFNVPELANVFALSGYWLLFVGIIWMFLRHLLHRA